MNPETEARIREVVKEEFDKSFSFFRNENWHEVMSTCIVKAIAIYEEEKQNSQG